MAGGAPSAATVADDWPSSVTTGPRAASDHDESDDGPSSRRRWRRGGIRRWRCPAVVDDLERCRSRTTTTTTTTTMRSGGLGCRRGEPLDESEDDRRPSTIFGRERLINQDDPRSTTERSRPTRGTTEDRRGERERESGKGRQGEGRRVAKEDLGGGGGRGGGKRIDLSFPPPAFFPLGPPPLPFVRTVPRVRDDQVYMYLRSARLHASATGSWRLAA